MPLIGIMNSGVSALKAFSKGMEVIGDNIANVNTSAFKNSRAQYADNFGDILQHSASSPASGNGSDVITMQVGEGVHIGSIKADFTQGSVNPTGQPTDFAISGNSFFRVRDVLGNKDYATRAGDFRQDDHGFLVTTNGFRVQGLSDGAAQMTATVVNGKLSYAISSTTDPATVGDLKLDSGISIADGTLTNGTGGLFTDDEVMAGAPKVTGFGVSSSGDIIVALSNGETFNRGRVLLQDYQDVNALTREAGNLYSNLETANPKGGLELNSLNNTPGQNGNGEIQQGALELSNVDLTEEFSQLINTQRSFQAGSRVITTADQVLEEIVNLKR